MKEKLTFTMAVILFNMLLATAFSPLAAKTMNGAATESRTGSKIHFSDKCVRPSQMDANKMGVQNSPRREASTGANGEIRVPSGTPYDYLYSYYMIDAWGESNIAGSHVQLYYDSTDNSVYIENFLPSYMGDCYYVGGKLISGDLQNGVLEMDARKAVYYSWGEWLMLIVAYYNEQTGDFYVKENESTFKLNIKDGVITNNSDYLALASVTNDTDVYWLQANICLDPIDMSAAKIVEIPANAVLSHYYQTVNDSDESIATVYRDGNDFFFTNIFGQDFTFKGVLGDDNRIAVEMPQLVKMGDEFVYVNTYYPSGNSYQAGSGETVYFDYDAGDISYYGGAPIALFSGNKYLYLSYESPYASLDLVKFTDEEEPTVVPASAAQRLYTMSTGYDYQGNHKGGLMKIARDGNTVYFLRVDNNNYDVVMKGELDPATNKVTVSLSQIIGVRNSTFLGLSLAKQSVVEIEDYYAGDYNEIRYVYDEATPASITIDYDPETETYKCNDVLAIIDAKRHTVSIALINPSYSPVDDVAAVPSDAETNEYVFCKDGDVNNSNVVYISRKGDDFYFVHPSPNSQVEEMTIHGVLNADGKIEIAVPQLVAYGTKDQGAFLRVGSWDRVYTPEDVDLQVRSWVQFTDDDVDSISFDFDEGLHEFDFDGYFSFVQFSDNKEILKADGPSYKPYVTGAFEPAAPTDLAIYGKSEDYWGNYQRYRLDFLVPCQAVDGTYLPYDNISFRLYFNDEPFVFTPDEYPLTFTDEVIDVPFNHPASSEIPHPIWNSNMRQVYLYSLPSEKIGVQSCYTFEGVSIYSEISYLDLTSLGIENITNEIPVNVQYYDVWGRETNGSQPGLTIVKKTYPDGRVVSEKIMVN